MTLTPEEVAAVADAHERRAFDLRVNERLSDPSDITPDRLATIANHFTIAAGLRDYLRGERP